MGSIKIRSSVNKTVATLIVIILSLSNTVSIAIAGEDEWVTNGPSGCSVNSIAISPKHSTNNTLYCATDNGTYKSTNGGQSWIICGLSGMQISAIAISPVQSAYDTLFAGTGTAIYKSTDSGSTWSQVSSISSNIQSIAVSPAYNSDKTVLIGTNTSGIFVSSDSGNTWTQCSGDNGFESRCISSIAFSPSFFSDRIAFSATSDGGGIYKTTDGGNNWTRCASASTVGSFITAIAVSPGFPSDKTVFCGKYYSTDSGDTWSATGGLSGVDVSSLEFSPDFSNDQTIFAGTYGNGVYQSTNKGSTWIKYDSNDDLNNLYIKSMAATPDYSSNHTIFAGTWGDGVFSCITFNDNVSPVTISTDPVNSETGVLKNKTIVVKFSENIVAGSTYDMIFLKDSANKTIKAGKSIKGRFLSVNPSSNLSLNNTYMLTVPAGAVKDSDGNSLASQFSIAFTVAGIPDKTAPRVSATDPKSGSKAVASDKTIEITFSEPVHAGTAYANIDLIDKSNTQIEFKKSISDRILTIDPSSDLPSGMSYTLTIPKGSVIDNSGNSMKSKSTVIFTVPVDNAAPKISGTIPAANATNMSKDSSITIEFSENIQSGTAYDSIVLKDSASASLSIAKTISDNVLTIVPDKNLDSGTFYTVTLPVSAIKDTAGNGSASQFILTFKVQGESETPSAPQGIKLVSTDNSIVELAWNSNTESDLAGYHIYRSIKGDSAGPIKLNTASQTETEFSDEDVEAGKTYTYCVTAIDKTNHESAKSTEVQATLQQVQVQVQVQEEKVIPVSYSPFRDVSEDAWYLNYVTLLTDSGVISGYADGSFRPVNNVTRAEFAKMICAAMQWDSSSVSQTTFKDLTGDFWGRDFIETVKSKGAISGYADGSFRPNHYITRAEIAKIVVGTLSLTEGSSTLKDINSSWASSYIKACANAGIVNGYSDGTFKPFNNATRAEVSKIVATVVERKTNVNNGMDEDADQDLDGYDEDEYDEDLEETDE